LPELVAPQSTGLILMELKRITVGDLQASSPPGAPGNELAAVAERRGLLPAVVDLADAARAAGVRVVHCTAAFRPDGAGSATNAPILAAAYRHRQRLLEGSPEAEPALELGPAPEDLRSVRFHGVAAFGGTGLDAMLRNLGVRTIVLVGGSVNVGIVGTAVEAVDLGYRVVVPRDAVVGYPEDYAEAVLEHTVALLARLTTVEEMVGVWRSSRAPGQVVGPG
jgi:nicotinamidase-related amidase